MKDFLPLLVLSFNGTGSAVFFFFFIGMLMCS